MGLKSTKEDLQKRGYASDAQLASASHASNADLLEMLHSKEAVTRTIGASHLDACSQENAKQLIEQLTKEKCLYTKIAISRSLAKGNEKTATLLLCYLGEIGSNQYHTLPMRPSAKKSYPLARDVIARILANMNPEIAPILLEALKRQPAKQVSELLDAIGFMVFYHPKLATITNANYIYDILEMYSDNELITWKAILCLSAFPLLKSKEILETFLHEDSLLAKEARRSLQIHTLHKGESIWH